jgi:pilus assembly protein CpaE
MQRGVTRRRELTGLAILAERGLSQEFGSALGQTRAVHLLAELKAYPSAQTLEVRIRQLRPDIVFVDLSLNREKAVELIQFAAGFRPQVHVIALDRLNDPEAILLSVRAGATEFLHAPFDSQAQREAIERIRKMVPGEQEAEPRRGQALVFSSAKPGSGASTLAWQTAFALGRLTSKRVLLADLDSWNGTQAFACKVRPAASVADALGQMEQMDEEKWSRLVVAREWVDVMPAPELPASPVVEPAGIQGLLECAQALYEWVLVDAPAIFERTALLAATNADRAFLITTAELPSLHMTRKAAALLVGLGLSQERFRVLVNRAGRRGGISTGDMAGIFNAPVHACFPNDYASLHQALADGGGIRAGCSLGRAVEDFAEGLAGLKPADKQNGRRKT